MSTLKESPHQMQALYLQEDVIIKKPELEKGQDYAFLRQAGIEHIEKLGHRLWTDYNVHDPGITLLEALCFAITDLGYRTGYPVRDILTEEVGGVQQNLSNFHQALEILSCDAVTFDDLRKVLIDIEGVRNAWVELHRSIVYGLDRKNEQLLPAENAPETLAPLNGLYDVYIEYEDYIRPQRLVGVGMSEPDLGSDSPMDAEDHGILFDVLYPLTLVTVDLYPQQAGEVIIWLMDEYDERLYEKRVVLTKAHEKNTVSLDFSIPAGSDYRLLVVASATQLVRTAANPFPFERENLILLKSGVREKTPKTPYYFFYNWQVSYAIQPGRAVAETKTAVVGLLDNSVGAGGYILPAKRGLDFYLERNAVLEAVQVYTETTGTVTINLLDEEGEILDSVSVENSVAGSASRIVLGFALSAGKHYRLNAQGTEVKLYRNQSGGFPHEVINTLSIERGHPSAGVYYFFYHCEISYSAQTSPVALSSIVTRGDIHLAARERLFAHRNLGEDFINICDLEEEAIAVCADIEVLPSVDVEALLAEIFYRLYLHISPSIQFYTIDEMLTRGKRIDEIFNGPKLDHGFIDDDEFREIKRRCEFRSTDLLNIIMALAEEGVVAVKNIALLSFIDGLLTNEVVQQWVLELSTDRYRTPVFSPERSKFVFYKNDIPYYANRQRVYAIYEEKKARAIHPKLKGHEKNLPIPVGVDRHLADYYPVQNELPSVYRVGRQRVAQSDSDLRKAQSRQLKAFMLFFEQILANYLAQLGKVRHLFSWDDSEASTYFTRAVTGIANIDELYVDFSSLENDLERLIESETVMYERRNRFLDHLMARFCESFTEYSLFMYAIYKDRDEANTLLLADKRALLQNYPAASAQRHLGYDYRYPQDVDNLTGYQRRLYYLLGFTELQRRDLAGHRFKVIEGVDGDGEHGWQFVLRKAGDSMNLYESIFCSSEALSEALLDFSLTIGGDSGNYQFDSIKGRKGLVRKCSDVAENEFIGHVTDDAHLPEVIAYFAQIAANEGFHLIEHILLRKRTTIDPFMPVQLNAPGRCDCVEVSDPYSFRASVYLPAWPRRFQNIEFRKFIEDTLRREAPAHLFLKVCWISHQDMQLLEEKYDAWSLQLAERPQKFAGCGYQQGAGKHHYRSGQMKLPEAAGNEAGDMLGDYAYRDALAELIETMHTMANVYPLARMYDCGEMDGDTPPLTLNRTRIGTF